MSCCHSGGFSEGESGIVKLEEMRAEIVEKVCEYLLYKQRYGEGKEDPPDFQDRVKPEIALELYVLTMTLLDLMLTLVEQSHGQ